MGSISRSAETWIDVAMNDRNDALLVRGQVNFSAHVGMNVADILNRDLRVDGQCILIGHDVEDLFSPLMTPPTEKTFKRHHPPGIGRSGFPSGRAPP